MKYPTTSALSFLAIMFTLPAIANDSPPAGQGQLKQLDWMIGSWVWQWNTDQEVPEIAGSGTQISGEMTCKWDLNGHAIDMRLSLRTPDTKTWTARTLIGWDPETEQLITRSFDSRGGHGSGTLLHQGDQWLLKTLGINADGDKLANALLFSDIKPDGFSLQGTNRNEGSDAVSFGPKTKFHRK